MEKIKMKINNTKKDNIVIQKNDLIRGDYKNLNTNDIKMFKFLVSKVNSRENLFQDYYFFTNKEIQENLNINDNNIHKIIFDSLMKLSSVFIVVEDTKNKEKRVGLIKNEIEYYKGGGRYAISFNNDLMDYILNINNNFTTYNLLNIKHLKKREIKLFEYLKSISFLEFEIGLEKLMGIMEVEGSYKEVYNFKKLLDKTIDRINEYTPIQIENHTYIRVNRKIKSVYFHFTKSKELTPIEKLHNLIGKDIRLNGEIHKILELNYDKSHHKLEIVVLNIKEELKGKTSMEGELEKLIEDIKNLLS